MELSYDPVVSLREPRKMRSVYVHPDICLFGIVSSKRGTLWMTIIGWVCQQIVVCPCSGILFSQKKQSSELYCEWILKPLFLAKEAITKDHSDVMITMKSRIDKCIEKESKYMVTRCREHRNSETWEGWEIKEFILEVVKRSKVWLWGWEPMSVALNVF